MVNPSDENESARTYYGRVCRKPICYSNVLTFVMENMYTLPSSFFRSFINIGAPTSSTSVTKSLLTSTEHTTLPK